MSNDNRIEIVASLDINASVEQVNRDLKKVQSQLNKLIVSAKLDKKTEKEIKALTQSLTQLQRITEQIEKQKISIAPRDEGLTKVLDKLDQFNVILEDIRNNNSLDVKTAAAENNIENVDKELKNVKGTAESAGKSLKDMLSGVGIHLTAYQALRMLREAIKEVGEAVDDYNKYHTNLRIITGEDNAAVDKMLEGYTEESLKLGVDISEYESAAETILRTGKNAAETNEYLKQSVVLSKTGFIDSEKAASNLITIANAYDLEAEAIENVVDKLLSLDVASMTEAGALSTAVARTAKNAQLAGISLDSLASQIANLRDLTGKEEEQIATSLNSIYSRMYNVKLGKFVIEDESGVEDITEDISDMEKILKRVDIQLRDSKGSFRDFDNIIKDLHDNWESFNEVEKSAIAKTIGGAYHRGIAINLIQNYEDFQKLQDISLNSAGAAAERYEAYTESIAAKSAQLNTALKQMWSHTIDSDFVVGVKETTAEVVQFIDKYEVLQNLMKSAIIYAAAKGFVYLGGTVKEAYTSFKSLSQAFNSLSIMKNNAAGTTAYQNALSGVIAYSQNLSDSQVKLLFSTKQLSEAQMMQILQLRGLSQEEAAAQLATMGLTAAEGNATAATFTLSGAFKTLGAAIAANPIGAAATAIMALFSVFSIVKRKQEEAAEAERQLYEQLEQNIQQYKSEEAALDDIIAKYSKLSASTEDTAKVRDELSKMQAEIVSKYGEEAEAIDLVNGKYSEEIEKLYELKRAQADVFVTDEKNIEAYKKSLEKLNNAGNINGDIDVNVAYKGGISQDILDQWKELGLIVDALQYSMSSKDYGFSIEGGENAETLYKTLEKMAESYKELATAAGDFNEEQYTAIKQQALEAKNSYTQAKEVVDLFENNKTIAEFTLSGDAKQQFDDLLDRANELNRILSGDASAVEKYSAAQKLSEVRSELEGIAGSNTALVQIIDDTFSVIENGATSAYTKVGDLRSALFEGIDEAEKNTLKTVESMESALQTIANGDYLDHSVFWELAKFDTSHILDGAKLVGDQFSVTGEQLIKLKDEYINNQLSALRSQQMANAEALKGLDEERRELLEQLKLQKEIVAAKLSGKGVSTVEFVKAQSEINRINALIKQNEDGQAKYNEQIQYTNLLCELWSSKLGNTVDMTEALSKRQKKLNDEISTLNKEVDARLKAQEHAIDGIISGHEKELTALEAEKNALRDELDTLNEQKNKLDEIVKNYDAVNSTVQKTVEARKNELEAEKKAIEDSYNDRIKALQAENEQREDALEYAQKLANLENAKNNKVRVYDEARGWHYASIKEDVVKAENDLKAYETSQAVKKLEEERDAAIDSIEDQIKSEEKYGDLWQEIAESIQTEEQELLAEQILGADWRQKIAEHDIEVLDKFRTEYRAHNLDLKNLTNGEIKLKEAAIKTKEEEIKSKKEQIEVWKSYKKEIQDTVKEAKDRQDEYVKYLSTVTISENSSLEEREKNLGRFRDSVTGMIDTITAKQGAVEEINRALADISGGDYQLNFSVGGLGEVRDLRDLVNDIRYGVGVIMSEQEALELWASGKLSAADMVNKYKNGDVRRYSEGGVADYTGIAMLHGRQNAPETIFNAKDSAKLYEMVHNTPNLMADMVNKAVKINNVNPTTSANTVINNTVNVDKVVTDSPKDFTNQMDKYFRTKLTESYTQK